MRKIIWRHQLFVLALMMCLNTAYGQSGCLVSGGNVYTSPESSAVNAILALLIGPGYKGSPIPAQSPCINGSLTVYIPSSNICRVCPTPGGSTITIPGVLVTCGVPTIDGKLANPTIIQCNLDDYTMPLFTAAGFFVFLFIRRRKPF